MWRLISGVYRTSFDTDPGVMAFREGERNLRLRYLADAQELAPREYELMTQEQGK